MYTALTVTLAIILGVALLVSTIVYRWRQYRWMYGEHGPFYQSVAVKRQLLYEQLKSRHPLRWSPRSTSYVPASSFALAYQDAVARIRLENDVNSCLKRIDASMYIKETVADQLIGAQDQLDELMKRWNNGLLISEATTIDSLLL